MSTEAEQGLRQVGKAAAAVAVAAAAAAVAVAAAAAVGFGVVPVVRCRREGGREGGGI